jgi:general secretion pathway protein K
MFLMVKKFMPAIIIRNNRGIALLITLTIISVLIVVTLEMRRKMLSAVFSAASTRDRMTLLHLASSGINAGKAMLIQDKNNSKSDSLQEDWANPDKINEVLQDISFEDGKVTLLISDELSKIQVNSLVEFPEGRDYNATQMFLWGRFLKLLISLEESFEEIEPITIVDSIKDWLDSGDDDAITGLNGAESEYYQDLDPPYSCRNGPFTHIGELAFVRGVIPELFYGAEKLQGISKFLTVFGMTKSDNSFAYDGKININTAELPVLAAILPLGHHELAQEIYDYRQETSDTVYINDLSSPTWYKNVPGIGNIEIDPKLIKTSSDFFRIESVATLNEMQLKITEVVKREKNKKNDKWECRVLRWEAE